MLPRYLSVTSHGFPGCKWTPANDWKLFLHIGIFLAMRIAIHLSMTESLAARFPQNLVLHTPSVCDGSIKQLSGLITKV